MGLSFIYPAVLWLLVLIPLLLGLALLAPRRLPRGRFWASLMLRALLLTALVLALAGAQFVRGVDRLTTVFLVDSSDSISPEERTRAETFVADALGTMRDDDQAAIVAFGANALVERAPSPERGLRRDPIRAGYDTHQSARSTAIWAWRCCPPIRKSAWCSRPTAARTAATSSRRCRWRARAVFRSRS